MNPVSTMINWQPLAAQVARNGGVTLSESLRVTSPEGVELVVSLIVETPEAHERRIGKNS